MKTIIPNTQPIYVIEPTHDTGTGQAIVDESCMSLVIAWSVCTDEETTPIGIEELLKFEGDFIFYNKDINKWTVPEDCSGFGFQTLQEYVDEGR